MMKILAICGSPRSGNTYKSLEQISELFPALNIEILPLMDIRLEPCIGHYKCVLEGEQYCPLMDDRDVILDKMRATDGIILASPAYSQMVSAPIKNFFDRLSFLYHRPEFFDKFAMSLVTFSDSYPRPASAYMNKMLSAFGFSILPEIELQFKVKYTLKENLRNGQKDSIAAINTLIVRIGKGEIDPPSLEKLIPFKVYKHMSLQDRDLRKVDFEYYKDKKDYHYEADIGLVKKMIANRISHKIIRKLN